MVNSWSINGLSGLLVVISWSLWLLVVTRGHVRAVFTIRKRTIRTVGAEPNYGHGGFFQIFQTFTEVAEENARGSAEKSWFLW